MSTGPITPANFANLRPFQRMLIIAQRGTELRNMGARALFAHLNTKRVQAEANGVQFRNSFSFDTGELR